jgi:hypothetical protein
MESAENCTFFYGERNGNRHFLDRTLFMPKKNLSAIKAEQLVSDMMSRIRLRNRRCDYIVLNRHASNNKSDDAKDNLYEELGSVFNYLLHHVKFC